MSKSDPKDEYLDAAENIRHWANIRFAQLTVFMAITAGLLAALFQSGVVLANLARTVLKIGGIVVVIIFWVMDERATQYAFHFLYRARVLEKELGYQQYTTTPPRGIFTGRNAVRLLFCMLLVFWLIALIWPSQF